MTDDETPPLFEREMTMRDVHGRRIRRRLTAVHGDDGEVVLDVEDEEVDDALVVARPAVAPVIVQPAEPKPVMRSPLEATMGEPDFRWTP